ncbi:MAG: hypothetical protein M3373_01890 [Gemmatimonadota bacterium]|nr:hypothetical protein [Gemmatimonadota bacterium]
MTERAPDASDRGGELEGDWRAAALWLRALERLVERAAHEIKNPLNGAVLNTEVLRARTERGGVEGAALAPFAAAAAAELARVVALTEALLALARPLRTPVDLEVALPPLVILARTVAAARGGDVQLDVRGGGSIADTLGADAVRGVVATVLDAAVAGGAMVRCAVAPENGRVVARVAREGGFTLPDWASRVIEEMGVGLSAEVDGYSLLFPAR